MDVRIANAESLLVAGAWRSSADQCGRFRASDPASGMPIGPWFPISGAHDVEDVLVAASAVAETLAACPAEQIAAFLERYADDIEGSAGVLVALAYAETALPAATRLATTELPRTTWQLRQAAKAVRERSWCHPVIDTPSGLCSQLAPLGKPVLVFGPNNFPLAFNAIAGSDFASAIAARNPVIAKAHPSHPATSRQLAEIAHAALIASGLPPASIQLLYDVDRQLGLELVADPRLGAVGFTGSRAAGLALKAAADRVCTPFYAEMSSVNPVFLLPDALVRRAPDLAQEFFTSSTLGGGQFCTKPGIVVVPDGEAGDAFVNRAKAFFDSAEPAVLFSRGVQQELGRSVVRLRMAGADMLAGHGAGKSPGYRFAPTLLGVDAARFLRRSAELQAEAFGPVSLVLRVADAAEMVEVARCFEGNLTGTLHCADTAADRDAFARIAAVLRPRVGRLIANKWPTGVAVSAAMQHGGPFPSTSHPGFTAVGMPTAIRRFAALQCYDQVPDELLPAELRAANPLGIPRCVDGRWQASSASGQENAS